MVVIFFHPAVFVGAWKESQGPRTTGRSFNSSPGSTQLRERGEEGAPLGDLITSCLPTFLFEEGVLYVHQRLHGLLKFIKQLITIYPLVN